MHNFFKVMLHFYIFHSLTYISTRSIIEQLQSAWKSFFNVIIVNALNKDESAKLRALRTKDVLTCLRALPAYVLTCQCALRAYVLTCQRALHAYVLTCQRVLRAYVLTCQRVLRAYVLTCQRALRAYVLVCKRAILNNVNLYIIQIC